MYSKILTKPKQWNEETLALATKEDLVADLLLRKSRLQSYEERYRPWNALTIKKERYWIQVVEDELRQRREWVIG